MIEQSLSQLESAQLVRRSTETEKEPTFLFKHALTQEAAYSTLLLKSRRQLHQRVAQAYEQLYTDQLDEYAALLARHYGEAGDVRKTLDYSRRAGDAAARVNANLTATTHYGRAIEMAQALIRSGGEAADSIQDTLVDLYRRRGRLLELSSEYEQAAANYVEMEAEGERLGAAEFRLAAMIERAKLLSTPNPKWDWARGMTLAQQALALARELGDRVAQARLLWILLLANYYGSINLDQAARYGEESAALARQLNLREQLAHTLNDMGGLYAERGEVNHSLAVLSEAEFLWRELDNMPMLTDTLANSATAHFYLGEFKESLRISEEGFVLGQSIGNIWAQANCRMMIGQVHIELGQLGRAIETMESTIALGDQAGHPGVPIVTRSMLAWALGQMGEVQKGIEIARVAVERGNSMPPFRPWALAALGRLELDQNDLDAAAIHLKEAESTLLLFGSSLSPVYVMIAKAELALGRKDYAAAVAIADQLLEHLRRTESRAFVYEGLFLKAKGLLGNRQVDAAYGVLKQAEREAEAVGTRNSYWALLLARSKLEVERGQSQEADKLHARARGIVQELARSIYQSDLRRTFEKQPDIQDALKDEE